MESFRPVSSDKSSARTSQSVIKVRGQRLEARGNSKILWSSSREFVGAALPTYRQAGVAALDLVGPFGERALHFYVILGW
jgi:hypothetical protein